MPPKQRCPVCAARVATAQHQASGLINSTSGVLTLSEITWIGPAAGLVFTNDGLSILVGIVWMPLIFLIIPAAHLLLLFRSRWALFADRNSQIALSVFVVALLFTVTSYAPQSLGIHRARTFDFAISAAFAGTAIAQVGLCLMLLQIRRLRIYAIVSIVLAAAQLLGAVLLLSHQHTRLPMAIILIALSAQIATLYLARRHLKRLPNPCLHP